MSPGHDVAVSSLHQFEELLLVIQLLVVDPLPVFGVGEHQSLLVELGFLFGFEFATEEGEVALEVFSVILEHVVIPFKSSPNSIQSSQPVSGEYVVSTEYASLYYTSFTAKITNWRTGLR